MAFDRTVSFSALGVTAAPPRSFLVRLAGEEALGWISGAPLDPWELQRLDGDEPVAGSLFDEQIFGPLRRDAEGRVRWERWSDVEPRDRPQAVRFGSLPLPFPVVHPWVLHTMKGQTGRLLRQLSKGKRVVVSGAVVRPEEAGDDDAVQFGAKGLLALCALGEAPVDESAALWRIPVLPAGLRPVVREGGGQLVHDLTLLYDLVRRRIVRLTRLQELSASEIILRSEIVELQRAVSALFLGGAVLKEDEEEARLVPAGMRRTPDFGSLATSLRASRDWAAAVDTLARAEPRAFSKRWHSPAYFYRAWLEASALELVPLDAAGAVDEAALAKSRVDRAARLFNDVYTEILGSLWPNVIHDRSGSTPHVDVYASGPRPDGTILVLTAGMSTARMHDHPLQGPCAEPHAELAMRIPADLEPQLVEHLMHGLLALARYPFRNATHFAPRHDVLVGKPIAPGSALSAFVFARPPEEEPFGSLSLALPRSPRYLLALGITEAEQRRLVQARNAAGAVQRLVERTRGVTAPGRPDTGEG